MNYNSNINVSWQLHTTARQ